MDSSTLYLPVGSNACHVNGMREFHSYNVATDLLQYRWDTIIDGKQHGYSADIGSAKEALDSARKEAREYFEKIEAQSHGN